MPDLSTINNTYTTNMGAQESLPYSVDVPGQQQPRNSTKVKRNPYFVDKLLDAPHPNFNTLQLILQKTFR